MIDTERMAIEERKRLLENATAIEVIRLASDFAERTGRRAEVDIGDEYGCGSILKVVFDPKE